MIYVACSSKDSRIATKLAGKRAESLFSVTLNEEVTEPIIYTKDATGAIKEWFRGREALHWFITHGYVFFRKKCPYRVFGKCTGTECQLFVIHNYVGDCTHKWSSISGLSAKSSLETN